MIRVVLDTNIIVSAYLNQEGVPFFILKLALAGSVQPCVSEAILAEYEELLHRKSYPMDRRRAKTLLRQIRTASEMFAPAGGLDVTEDPDDNIFLECALAAKAHYLVTGNTDHFPKKRWKYTSVITPRQFINIWKDLRPGDETVQKL
jgi:putative PIN family toxin of toxin-antitoxin system